MSLARTDFEDLNEIEICVEATRVQCAMLEYQLGLKTVSIHITFLFCFVLNAMMRAHLSVAIKQAFSTEEEGVPSKRLVFFLHSIAHTFTQTTECIIVIALHSFI